MRERWPERVVLVLLWFWASGAAAGASAQQSSSLDEGPAVAGRAPSERSSGGARLEPGQPLSVPELQAFVDGLVRQAMSADRIAGAAVAVVQDDRVLLAKGYGLADVEQRRPVDASTLFRIGSISKTFTWIALMNAVEAGRLGLDDPVNDHLPEDLRVPDQGYAEPIRVRHLMTHRPGFEDRVLGHLFERDAADIRPLGTYLREERPDRVREPGTVSAYSNYGVALAGAMLERLHGRPWQDIVEAEILVPLGMTHTTAREPYPPRADLPAPMAAPLAGLVSKGYRWTGLTHTERAFEYITHIGPAGAMSSSAGDMARFMRMLLNEGTLEDVRVFGPEAARAFQTPMTDLPRVVGNWAGGFWETLLPGGLGSIGHDGGTTSFFSSMALVPELRLGIFVVTNTERGAALSGPLPGRVVGHFYASQGTRDPAGSAALSQSARVYEGYYVPNRRPYSGLEGFVFRLQALRVAVTSDGYLTIPLLGRTLRFVPADEPDVFRPADDGGAPVAGLVFRRDGDRATRIDTFLMAFDRVGPLFQPPTLVGLAVVALGAAFGTLLGMRIRIGRGLPQTPAQQLASVIQVAAAVLWLASALALALALVQTLGDPAEVLYTWPAPAIRLFSLAALAATALSVCGMLLVPAVWRSRHRPGWTIWRTLRFTAAIGVFAAFGVLMGLWGALWPF